MRPLTYGSVCSGIEAASVAWEVLGYSPVWFSQFDPEHKYKNGPDFPSAVLAHHWPQIPNLGDMTKIAAVMRAGELQAPDILVGGTPCQAFSVAGARAGLSDPRGQLTISYGELADAIDERRTAAGLQPAIIVWENVPGVLSSKDNAFGAFIGLLAGEDCELQPPGKRWTNAGYVRGPKRAVAWRILDAQYFGVAQRRRRVFVIASARTDIDPAQILFESDGVRRDIAPSRSAGQETTGTITSRTSAGGGLGDFELSGGLTVANSLTAHGVGTCGADDNQAQAGHLIPQCVTGDISHTLKARGFDGSEDGTGRGTPIIAAFGGGRRGGPIDVAACLTAKGQRIDFEVETFAVHGTQDPDTNINIAHTLGRNHGQENAVAYGFKGGQGAKAGGIGFAEEQCPTLTSANSGTNLAPTVLHSIPLAFAENSRAEVRLIGGDGSLTGAIAASHGKPGMGHPVIADGMAVRRLTPVECERLQGFPDNHTLIPTEKRKQITAEEYAYLRHHFPNMTAEKAYRLAADGPRYKAIGNSMAVPVMRWIGARITKALEYAS